MNHIFIDDTPKEIIQRALPLVKEVFALDFNDGIHGVAHWSRVWHHGKRMAQELDVNPRIPAWFSFLHDSQRENDDYDENHGSRAADFAMILRNQGNIGLDRREFDALCYAMQKHSDGHTEADVSVQVCWDADRLDLGRVGITPNGKYLCTEMAKQPHIIERAVALSEALERHAMAIERSSRSRSPSF